MVEVLNLFLLTLFINDRHETKVTKFWYKCNEAFTKHLLFLEYILLYKKCLSLLVLVHRRTQNIMIMDLKKWSQINFIQLEPHDYRIIYVNFDLHDQYGHLVPKCRIFPFKHPWLWGAKKEGCICRLCFSLNLKKKNKIKYS